MMARRKEQAPQFLLLTTIGALSAFCIGAIVGAALTIRFNLAPFDIVLAGGLGGLLLGFILLKHYSPLKLALAGFVAIPIGFFGAFIVVEGFGMLLGMAGLNMESGIMAELGNIVAIVLMGAICSLMFGAIIFGANSLWLFAIVGGVAALPAGYLVGLFNAGHAIKDTVTNMLAVFGAVDLNMIVIIGTMGLGIGLSMGLYERHR